MGGKIMILALYEAKEDVSDLISRLENADKEIDIDALSNVGDLIERLQGDECDCVLSDAFIQGFDVIDLGKKVREIYNTPFFIYTGRKSDEMISKALNEGIPYFNGNNRTAHKKLLKRIKFIVEKARNRKNGGSFVHFDKPTVYVQGSEIFVIDDDGRETVWDSEGEDHEDVARQIEREMKATNYVRNELAHKLTELSEDLLQTDLPSADIPNIVHNGYLKLSRWFKNTKEFNKS